MKNYAKNKIKQTLVCSAVLLSNGVATVSYAKTPDNADQNQIVYTTASVETIVQVKYNCNCPICTGAILQGKQPVPHIVASNSN